MLNILRSPNSQAPLHKRNNLWQRVHCDPPLLASLLLMLMISMIVLYSASGHNLLVIEKHFVRFCIATTALMLVAQIPPQLYRAWTPVIFGLGILLLVGVLVAGEVSKGAQRWLNLGFMRFQPAEWMRLAVPMMVAWYFHNKSLPPRFIPLVIAAAIILLPTLLIAKQPDLGTAIVIACSGGFAILLAGISWRLISGLTIAGLAMIPVLWMVMHDYQRQRVLTLFNPEHDPLGSGYHIIQSKIALGSGGLFGKGWLNGTQSHLEFLPERTTDFIFAVIGEEFGLIGILVVLALYMVITLRGFYIAMHAQSTYDRLLAGSLTCTFFFHTFVNIGMVSGILPVVGLPLPLISYGGTSLVILLISFGMLMSIHTHRKLLSA